MNSRRTKRRKCRLWWPSNPLASSESTLFLFGWSISSCKGASVDIVVAFAFDDSVLSSVNSNFQEILHETNEKMPSFLRDKCVFSLVGYYEAASGGNSQLIDVPNDRNNNVLFTYDGQNLSDCPDSCKKNNGRCSCGCCKFDGMFEQYRLSSTRREAWIKLVFGFPETIGQKNYLIPKLDHMHLNGEAVSELDLHVIFYEIPVVGFHHYSLGIQSSLSELTSVSKKPKWFEDLYLKDSQLDLDAVVLAMNSVHAAEAVFRKHLESERPVIWFHIFTMFLTFAWKLLALVVASTSALFYIILQFLSILLSFMSHSRIYVLFAKIFRNTWNSIQFRCCQLSYWPIFLQDHCLRSQSCVEFSEKTAAQKHLIWSNTLVDVFLGNLLGIALWFLAEPTCQWVSDFCQAVTNYLLRTGCVWLMGNPAGFKLNTELAGVLGIISLNAIQIWSTLWFFVGILSIHLVKGLAICGILFGLTTAASLVIDVILLAATHVLALHLFLSFLYSRQIQAIAALWRLFRGRKWNPLRQRFDSYDYTVEQHVLGTLLFMPLLLLLPTTSAFYIFFTILNTAVSFICIVVEVAICFIHATPYAKIFLWLVRRKRFPSGIWFEILSCRETSTNYPETRSVSVTDSSSVKLQEAADTSSSKSSFLVSLIHSSYLTLGEIVCPHYSCIYSAISRSSITSSTYGVLTGRGFPSSLGAGLPPNLPWLCIHWKEYWRLCYDAVYPS